MTGKERRVTAAGAAPAVKVAAGAAPATVDGGTDRQPGMNSSARSGSRELRPAE
ncbi:hypothetical protein Syun_019431 [Stephania yunnanensis]|uniref:Uncharacterized protein n=1 Tax=Stephania yunnanensis TaxID=152371 RepID=A0AAP0IU60_9MAGN